MATYIADALDAGSMNASSAHNRLKFKYVLDDPEAVPPHRAHPTDSGLDLYLIKKIKEENGVAYYTTGVRVQPPPGYYFELVGRSSISKTGYMLANNIGIIDEDYRGCIIAALVKVGSAHAHGELTLPAKIVQIIPKQRIDMEAEAVETLDDTVRGEGGFGSTNTQAA